MLKNLPANARDAREAGSIVMLGRSSGEGNGNPLKYSYQEYSHGTEEPGRLQSMWLQRFRWQWVDNIRPFRYDLNQIIYNYTVEVRSRFKGLDLIDRVPEELWAEVSDIVQETRIKTIPKKKMKKSKMAVWSFTNSCEKKRSKKQRRKGKIHPFECRVPEKKKKR